MTNQQRQQRNTSKNAANKKIVDKPVQKNYGSILKIALITSCLVCVISLCIWLWLYLTARDTLPLKKINIRGNLSHIDIREVQNLSHSALSWGFFSVDANALQHDLMKIHWVKSVKIKRTFPDTLSIEITEQRAAALWNHHQLMNMEGLLFSVPAQTMPKNLLQLFGPERERAHIFLQSKKMQNILMPLHLKLSTLHMSNRGSYEIALSNQIKIFLGRGNPLPKVEKFVKIYPILQQRIEEKGCSIQYVDLRYPHGFSVKTVERPQPINEWQILNQKVSFET